MNEQNPNLNRLMRSFRILLAVLFFCAPSGMRPACGQAWIPTTGTGKSVASSADGVRLLASGGSYLNISTNSGASWRSISPPNGADFVACSADGKTLLTVGLSGGGWLSTNFGATWSSPLSGSYVGCAVSANGKTLMAFPYTVDVNPPYMPLPAPLYVSTNGGTSWWQAAVPYQLWLCGACSADGTKLVAGGGPNRYVSTNSGATWNVMSTPAAALTSTAMSADGTKLVGAFGTWSPGSFDGSSDPQPRTIYTSADGGATWISNSVPVTNWNAVASSDDGTKLAAVYGKWASYSGWNSVGGIYTSTNGGSTWIRNAVPNTNWIGCASSADGSKLVAAENHGVIYTWRVPLPPLQVTCAASTLALSWPTSAMGVVLQQCSSLSASNWTAVPSEPIVTNGQNNVTVSPLENHGFYRLWSQ